MKSSRAAIGQESLVELQREVWCLLRKGSSQGAIKCDGLKGAEAVLMSRNVFARRLCDVGATGWARTNAATATATKRNVEAEQ